MLCTFLFNNERACIGHFSTHYMCTGKGNLKLEVLIPSALRMNNSNLVAMYTYIHINVETAIVARRKSHFQAVAVHS